MAASYRVNSCLWGLSGSPLLAAHRGFLFSYAQALPTIPRRKGVGSFFQIPEHLDKFFVIQAGPGEMLDLNPHRKSFLIIL